MRNLENTSCVALGMVPKLATSQVIWYITWLTYMMCIIFRRRQEKRTKLWKGIVSFVEVTINTTLFIQIETKKHEVPQTVIFLMKKYSHNIQNVNKL